MRILNLHGLGGSSENTNFRKAVIRLNIKPDSYAASGIADKYSK